MKQPEASIAIQVLPNTASGDEAIRVVDAVIAYLKSTELPVFVGPFETVVEGDFDRLWEIAKECHLIPIREGGVYEPHFVLFQLFSSKMLHVVRRLYSRYTDSMQNGNKRDIPSKETIKALALDLDGTLLGPGALLSERAIRILKTCLDRGIKVIICTGRSIEAADQYQEAVGATGPMVYFNGAEVVDVPSRKVLYTTLLDLDVVDYCADLARRRGLYYQAYFPETSQSRGRILLTEHYAQEAEMYHKHTGIQPIIGDLKKAAAAPGITGCIKSMFISDSSLHDSIRTELQACFGSRIYIVRSSPMFLEILHAGVSKGQGLKQAMEYQGLASSQVIAFGDEENDLSMFRIAGFSAAPANAKEEVRQAADIIIDSNAEDGVAVFLENLLS
ncbi:MAG: Cof-type HAD-IIB family hydrolase [Treponema sp.]|jgi:Cof subfamily protein (haloacid dehalogenase superfamily)|nr:Cof-type HAD-IIB family hydrolase [Treponema sp.]